jgi:hypothetical protein
MNESGVDRTPSACACVPVPFSTFFFLVGGWGGGGPPEQVCSRDKFVCVCVCISPYVPFFFLIA